MIIKRTGEDRRITLAATVDAYIERAPLALFTRYDIGGRYVPGYRITQTLYYFLRWRIRTVEEMKIW